MAPFCEITSSDQRMLTPAGLDVESSHISFRRRKSGEQHHGACELACCQSRVCLPPNSVQLADTIALWLDACPACAAAYTEDDGLHVMRISIDDIMRQRHHVKLYRCTASAGMLLLMRRDSES